ncbi:hypothetical protein LR48_Vigan02g004300 [Vigna angularis]|uniref:Uncharacterized protein n=1 Tax=Phaseolus angularis TaxID=3914 RepID=A0A0L9TTG7_PHAAN|nr:hypothetical protein LR48_Vigan02g004300 [Vigna angularis]
MSSSSQEHKSNGNEENNLRKGQWTEEEDAILAAYVREHGSGNWNTVQQNTGLLRCGKSCRLRWTNHLRPDLRRGAFSIEEQNKVIGLHALMGNKWAKMAQELPGRTDNEIKNFWNTRLKKRKRVGLEVYSDGIEPVFDAHNTETSLATNTHRDSEVVGTSSQHAMLNHSGNTQNQPPRVQPISMVRENMNLSVKPEENQMHDVTQASTSSCVPHVVFNNSSNTQNRPLYAQPTSMVRGNMNLPVKPEEKQMYDVPQASTSSCVPHVVFNNFSNTQNRPLYAQPTSMVRGNMNLPVKPEEKQMYDVPQACTSSCVPHVVFNNSINTQNRPLYAQPTFMVRGNMNLPVKPEDKQMYDVPQACTSSCVPHVVFNNSNNTQNQPLYAQPIFEEHHDFDWLPRDWAYDDYAELPPFPPSCDDNAKLPPLPLSCDDLPFAESMSLRENSEAETNRYYEPRSPRSNGYLETMFYPPKVSQEPDDFPMQGELNVGNSGEISDQKKPEDEDDLGDLIWIENEHGPYKDSSCGYVHPFLKP